jgi:alanine racemase
MQPIKNEHAMNQLHIHMVKLASIQVNNKWAPTLGVICMDMFMVEVTDIACKVGDEVIIFDQKHPARRPKRLELFL